MSQNDTKKVFLNVRKIVQAKNALKRLASLIVTIIKNSKS